MRYNYRFLVTELFCSFAPGLKLGNFFLSLYRQNNDRENPCEYDLVRATAGCTGEIL